MSVPVMHLPLFIWIFIMSKMEPIFFIILLFFSELSFSERVTININASVLERTCTISNDSLNQKIELQGGDLRQSDIGVPFGKTSFSINLIDCPVNLSSAHLKFSGESDSSMSNLLKNVNGTDAAAQGVALGLYNTNNVNVDITNNEETLLINPVLTTNIFNFFIYYVRVNQTAAAGKVTAIADFEIAYD